MGLVAPSVADASRGLPSVEAGARGADNGLVASVSYAAPLLDEPVSPELALVDPELAARLRALMPVPDIDLEPRRSNVRHLRLTPPPPAESEQPAVVPPAPPWRGMLGRLAAAFVAGAVLATLVTVGVVAQIGETELPREASPVSVPPVVPAPSAQAPAAPAQTPPATKARAKTKPAATKSQSRNAKPKTAARTAAAPEPRRLVWAPVAGAVGYRVELFRGDEQVLRATTKAPAFALGAKWRHNGQVERLTPGSYRWYVWPVLPGGAADQAIVQARLNVD